MRLHRTRRFASVFANACSVEPMEVRVLLSSTFHRDGHVAIIAKHDALGGENGVLGRYASGAIVTADGGNPRGTQHFAVGWQQVDLLQSVNSSRL